MAHAAAHVGLVRPRLALLAARRSAILLKGAPPTQETPCRRVRPRERAREAGIARYCTRHPLGGASRARSTGRRAGDGLFRPWGTSETGAPPSGVLEGTWIARGAPVRPAVAHELTGRAWITAGAASPVGKGAAHAGEARAAAWHGNEGTRATWFAHPGLGLKRAPRTAVRGHARVGVLDQETTKDEDREGNHQQL